MRIETRDVYLVIGDCGDYYCEAEHPIAVCDTEGDAKRIVEQAEKRTIGGPTHPKMWEALDYLKIKTNIILELK